MTGPDPLKRPVFGLLIAAAFATPAWAAEIQKGIEYENVDGESLKLDISVPDGKGPFPVAILIHGGGWGGGDRAVVYVPPTDPFTDAKFTWFSIDYRLAPQHRWPACMDDVRTAIRWIKTHAGDYKGDPDNITLVGYSAGGHLAAFAAATEDESTKVQGLVLFAGPTDLLSDCERRGEVSPALQALLDHGPVIDREMRTKLHELSPLNYLTHRMPPTLLIHGTEDQSVPYSQSVAFQAKLNDLNVPCELITIPGGEHRLQDWPRLNPDYQKKVVDWLHEEISSH